MCVYVCRPEPKSKGHVATEVNPAYCLYRPGSEATGDAATELEHNPAYGVNTDPRREPVERAQFTEDTNGEVIYF